MEIRYSKQAVKAIGKLDVPTKRRIKEAVEKIPEGDIKPMQGYSDGRQRLRVGSYRIIHKIMVENSGRILYIMDIGSRGDIYK